MINFLLTLLRFLRMMAPKPEKFEPTETELKLALESAKELKQSYYAPTYVVGNEQIRYKSSQLEDGKERIDIHIAGSNDALDWIQNFRVRIATIPLTNHDVHKGFLEATENLYSFLEKERKIPLEACYCIHGHSKGGAMAVILGLLLHASGRTVIGVRTFGQPKVGKVHIELPFTLKRYVSLGDAVPGLPPYRPWAKWIHFGSEKLIGDPVDDHVGKIRDAAKAHLMDNYIKALDKELHS